LEVFIVTIYIICKESFLLRPESIFKNFWKTFSNRLPLIYKLIFFCHFCQFQSKLDSIIPQSINLNLITGSWCNGYTINYCIHPGECYSIISGVNQAILLHSYVVERSLSVGIEY